MSTEEANASSASATESFESAGQGNNRGSTPTSAASRARKILNKDGATNLQEARLTKDMFGATARLFQNKINSLSRTLSQLQTESAKKINELESQLTTKEENSTKSKREKEQINAELAKVKAELEAKGQTSTETSEKLGAAMEQVSEMNSLLDRMVDQYNKLKGEYSSMFNSVYGIGLRNIITNVNSSGKRSMRNITNVNEQYLMNATQTTTETPTTTVRGGAKRRSSKKRTTTKSSTKRSTKRSTKVISKKRSTKKPTKKPTKR